MHKIMIATAAAVALMAGSANAAYAGEGNNLAATEVPAAGSGIRAGAAVIGTGSEAYPVFAASTLQQSNTAAYDTGSERYQDSAGKSSSAGPVGLARRNGNNAGA